MSSDFEFATPVLPGDYYEAQAQPDDLAPQPAPDFITTPDDLEPKDPSQIKLQFRTYKPYTKDLRVYQLPSTTNVQDFSWISAEADQILQEYASFEHDGKDFIDSNELYAKPTWDLKRDVKPQLQLLEQRTQQSINFLMQKKLLHEQVEQSSGPQRMGE